MTEFSNRSKKVTGSAIRELFKYMGDPNMISFGGGNPAKESFPIETVKEITNDVLTKKGAVILQYGPTDGYLPLREAVIENMLKPKGITDAKVENVIAVSGSMQSLDLVSKVFLDPGDKVLVESPTFLGALQCFNMFEAENVPVPMDDEGVIISELERLMKENKPKFFYCIPTFQNPTGKTLGIERRKAIAELASKYDVIIVEDDPYCDLRYKGEPLPTIKSFDKTGHVLLLNSFSKIISPGIRVGCIYGETEIIRKLTVAKQSADTHTSNLTQAIAAEFLNRKLLPGHLVKIIPGYAERMNAMLSAMDEYFPKTCKHTCPDGGLFIWCELPKGVEVMPIFMRSINEAKVAFVPGEHFFPDPNLGKNTFRLNFSAEPVDRITEGMKRLGTLLRDI